MKYEYEHLYLYHSQPQLNTEHCQLHMSLFAIYLLLTMQLTLSSGIYKYFELRSASNSCIGKIIRM